MLRALAMICGICAMTETASADASDWKRFAVKDIKLGDHLSELVKKGFKTCKHPSPAPRYILILDPRCSAKSGDKCTVDDKEVDVCMPFFNGRPALRGHLDELEHIAVTLTNSLEGSPIADPRVDEIDYYFPRQLLTEDSALGKMLVAKYGPRCTDDPSCYSDGRDEHDPKGGGRMVFTGKAGQRGARVSVLCDGSEINGHVTTQCWMVAEDPGILTADRAQQTELDMKKGASDQPPPPRF
jgi:hypothetical protein